MTVTAPQPALAGVADRPAKRPILVVDDEPEMLFSLRNLLRREFEVYTAAGAEEAIKILHEHVVHLVMTDQRMPQMTGVELLSERALVVGEGPALRGLLRELALELANVRILIADLLRYLTLTSA